MNNTFIRQRSLPIPVQGFSCEHCVSIIIVNNIAHLGLFLLFANLFLHRDRAEPYELYIYVCVTPYTSFPSLIRLQCFRHEWTNADRPHLR